jgi:glutamyl-tRNA synthetase
MAPSPTGALHVGGVRTAHFNWLFARHHGGEFRLRIENTDTSREVAEAVEQIQDSLAWLGLDRDGEVTFQLDRAGECATVARQLVDEGKAYEDEGAIRFRMPDDGVTAWDDVVKGPIEFPNAELEDLVLVRSDGRPTYNFASPLEDVWDGITHVIRGDDHVSNTPKQISIIRAIGADLPVYAHVPNVLGPEGASCRSVTEQRAWTSCGRRIHRAGAPELPGAARMELRRQDDTHVARRARGALLTGACLEERGHLRLREAQLDERRLPA